MSLVILDQSLLALSNTSMRASITVQNSAGVDTDPFELHLDIMNLGGGIVLEDVWSLTDVPVRLTHVTTGRFYIDLGVSPYTETNVVGELMLDWRVTMTDGGSQTHSLQKLKVISAKTASFLPEFRLMIDKSRKMVNQAQEIYLGYSDAQLVSYLEGGLTTINAYQPTINFSMEDFPLQHRQMLIDAGLITGVTSQQLYAIDTDIPNYSDQGTSFVISHQPQLAAFLNSVTQRLDKMIPMMKLQFVQSGTLHMQAGPNFRLQQLIDAAPSGSLFRNVYFKG